jgi:hypothetical protein
MQRLLIVGVAVMALGGCASLGAVDPYAAGHRLNGEVLGADAGWRDRFTRSENDAEARKGVAREFAYYLIGRSDRKCEDYLVGVSAGNNSFRGVLDLVSIGLNFAGTGASSLGSAHDLATGAGVVTSLRTSALTNLFAGNEFAVIYETVHRGRDAERKALIAALGAGQFDTWGPEAIAAVINAYDVKCGVNYASRLIREAVEDLEPVARTPIPEGPATDDDEPVDDDPVDDDPADGDGGAA